MDFLDEEANFFSRLSDDGAGVSEVSVEVLEDAVSKAVELELDADTFANLKKDIAGQKPMTKYMFNTIANKEV